MLAPVWPACWLLCVDKSRESKFAEVASVWEMYEDRLIAKQEMIRKVEAVEEKKHFRGIGEKEITSFIKLQVPGALGEQDLHMHQASLMAALQ